MGWVWRWCRRLRLGRHLPMCRVRPWPRCRRRFRYWRERRRRHRGRMYPRRGCWSGHLLGDFLNWLCCGMVGVVAQIITATLSKNRLTGIAAQRLRRYGTPRRRRKTINRRPVPRMWCPPKRRRGWLLPKLHVFPFMLLQLQYTGVGPLWSKPWRPSGPIRYRT